MPVKKKTLKKSFKKYQKYKKAGVKPICAVCLDEIKFNELAQEKCSFSSKHKFHQKCVDDLFKHQLKNCPNCRSSFTIPLETYIERASNLIDKIKVLENKLKVINSKLNNSSINSALNNSIIQEYIDNNEKLVDDITKAYNSNNSNEIHELLKKFETEVKKLDILYININTQLTTMTRSSSTRTAGGKKSKKKKSKRKNQKK